MKAPEGATPLKAVSYPCGCVLREKELESRFCAEALRLLGEAVSAHEDLMDSDLGGNDNLPEDADFRLDEHWARQERTANRRKTLAKGGEA
ncbi:MAG: hypothetical protein ACRDSJ_15175 [Rubrobacteraceae bacterium]